jgi:hypothetical protein
LERIIQFREGSLRKAIHEFLAHASPFRLKRDHLRDRWGGLNGQPAALLIASSEKGRWHNLLSAKHAWFEFLDIAQLAPNDVVYYTFNNL